ncbi:TPA: alanine racemase [Escherichia coli]|uniref:alanine racemase n=1 Tax=Escherichia coli TaxID=562 RepID=UPI003904CC09
MFVEALKRQNPALISAALSLWQQGKIAPDSWVIDVDQVLENGKRLIETARLYGIELYLMTKQFGRNPWLAEKLLALGYSGIVAVDYKEARVMRRAGLSVAHQGHLVQIPCHQVADAVEQGTDVITVFTLDKAREVSAATLRAAGVPALTDDNYAVMKVARIGCECGANVSTFSCFKLFGPEGVGAVVGDADVINRIRATLYSGGSQIQGAQALEVLRGLVFAPVMHAVQAGVSERLLALLNGGAVPEVKSAVIANAQSKVLIVEFHQPIAARVLEEAQKRGALPYPVGAESKYEIPPLFYRLSGTFRQANPQSEHCAIRINPNRSGEETVLRILRESIASI